MPAGVFKSETENYKDIFGIVCSAKTSEQNNFGIPFWKAVDQSVDLRSEALHTSKCSTSTCTRSLARAPLFLFLVVLHYIRPVQLFAIINNQANRI